MAREGTEVRPAERINDVLRKILSRGNSPYTRRLLDNERPEERISEVNKPYEKRLLGLKELHTSVQGIVVNFLSL